MNLLKLCVSAASIGVLVLSLSTTANAISLCINPTADGDVQIFGGNSVDTTDTGIAFVPSGGFIRNGILEFNLSGIADGSTINSASLDITLTRFVSNLGSNSAAINIFA